MSKQRLINDIPDTASKPFNTTVPQLESESEAESPRSNSETDESVVSTVRVFPRKLGKFQVIGRTFFGNMPFAFFKIGSK